MNSKTLTSYFMLSFFCFSLELCAESSSKKYKPQFVGVKRAEKPDKATKSRKIKNKWCVSKTQPKANKSSYIEEEEESLTQEAPYFIKTNALLADEGDTFSQEETQESSIKEEPFYPKLGLQAEAAHVFLSGEWLLWRTREGGTEFATVSPVEFTYTSGFRASLGVHLPSTEKGELSMSYTDYRPCSEQFKTGSFYPRFLFQGAGVSGDFVTEAKVNWNITYQALDLLWSRGYFLASSWYVHPFLGVQAVRINQKAHIDYAGGFIPVGENFSTKLVNDFQAIGPLFGIDMRWYLYKGLHLLAKISSALFMGCFDSSQKQDLQGMRVVDLDKSFYQASPQLNMLLACGWDYVFREATRRVAFYLGFESQYLWSQNQVAVFSTTLPSYSRENADLAFYGLTLQAGFDF